MFRLTKVLLLLALLVRVAMFFEKRVTVQLPSKHNVYVIKSTPLEGVSMNDIEYDSCLQALKCIKQNDLKGFNSLYMHNNQGILSNAFIDMKLKECIKWFGYNGEYTNVKAIHIDSVYGYADNNGSILNTIEGSGDKERITYVTFLFSPKQLSVHSSKLLTFEFSDKFSTDHFINWWPEDI